MLASLQIQISQRLGSVSARAGNNSDPLLAIQKTIKISIRLYPLPVLTGQSSQTLQGQLKIY